MSRKFKINLNHLIVVAMRVASCCRCVKNNPEVKPLQQALRIACICFQTNFLVLPKAAAHNDVILCPVSCVLSWLFHSRKLRGGGIAGSFAVVVGELFY